MISKNQQKLIRALGQKKQRKLHKQFLVQGEKNVVELLNSNLTAVHVFAVPEFIEQHSEQLSSIPVTETDEASLTKVSTLTANNSVIAIVEQPAQTVLTSKGIQLVLDGVSDPGNLGTIIRLADWFGIKQLILSHDCADPYNPKTISATMGSFCRINAVNADLTEYLTETNLPVYGAYLGGENVHQTKFEEDLILVMGSESHGIRPHLESLITKKITIPSFGQAESLNVAMATGIILDNVKRG